jgi:glycosyltransferase involved in cell wall biosynthesis
MRIGIDCRKIADFGIGTYIRGLLHSLAAMGGDSLVAFGPPGIAGTLPAGVQHVVVEAPNYSIRELRAVGRAADQAGLDLFHAPHYVVPFLRTPFVVTVHDLIHLRHRNPLARVYARAMIGRAVRRSRRVVTVSEAVSGAIAATFGGQEKIAVVPNGIDAIFFERHPPRGGRYFLFVGNDKPHKNVDRLVEAFAHIRGVDPAIQLVLVGAAFERFRGRDGVVTTGFVPLDELAAIYRGAIALVQPSLDEGFGLPVAEAMASATAVITSEVPALVELTEEAALHVDARSIDAIAGAMMRVMTDTAFRATLIARGVDRARAFTWNRCAQRTREVYHSAI